MEQHLQEKNNRIQSLYILPFIQSRIQSNIIIVNEEIEISAQT